MFAQYPYIAKQHIVALESAIRAHGHNISSGLSGSVIAKLYKAALDGIAAQVTVEGLATSRLVTLEKIVVSSATDTKTGVWIQLARVEVGAQPLLTIGQKWSMESGSSQVGNVATAIW